MLPWLLGLAGVILAHSLREDSTFFSLNEQSCLLNRKRREGKREGRAGRVMGSVTLLLEVTGVIWQGRASPRVTFQCFSCSNPKL